MTWYECINFIITLVLISKVAQALRRPQVRPSEPPEGLYRWTNVQLYKGYEKFI